MNQYQAERRLTWLYAWIVSISVISSICFAVAWTHWKEVLNFCVDKNCGCIFYGRTTASYFEGGHISTCLWAVFGPLPLIAVGLVMAGYHLIRVCINSVGKYENENVSTVEQREGEVIMMSARAESRNTDSVSYCWIPAAVFSSIFAIYSLVYASILTDGYYRTCNEYRGELVKTLHATGNQASAIYSRLGCKAMFDFMDYLQPEYIFDRHRTDYINTGLSLQLGLVCAWFLVFSWIVVAVYNSIRAYKDRHTSTCCGK